jgi:signal transduction histidine kinase
MKNEIVQPRNLRPLNIATYAPLLITTLIGLIVLPDIPTKLLALGLCIFFGFFYSFRFRTITTYSALVIYFLIQTAVIIALIILAHPSDAFTFLLFVQSIQITMLLPIRIAIPALVIFYFIDSKDAILSFDANGFIQLIFNGATIFFTSVLGYSLRQAEIADKEKQQALEELQKTQNQLQELAVTEERTRLAREMHDSLGHRLTVAVVQLEGAQRLIPTKPDQASQMIGTMRDELKRALAELRLTVTAMRSPVVDNQPLESSLMALCESFQQNTGLVTHFTVTQNLPTLPEPYRLAFYRSAQEGLTNAQRHADAQNVWIQLQSDDKNLTLILEDDGKGIDPQNQNNSGSGLLGLKERAEQLGGQIRISDRRGGGTQLAFIVPVPSAEGGHG